MDIVARWPGATHDQTIFNNSHIKHRLSSKEFGNCVIVGDRGYENTSYLLTPLQNPTTPAEHLYNESQIRSRNVVERAYGVWKNRFPILSMQIKLHLSNIQNIIVACAVLHNIAVDMREEQFTDVFPDHNDQDMGAEYSEINLTLDNTVRNNLIKDYFTSLLS